MSETLNPYQSPGTAAVPVKPLVSQGTLTETMLLYLKGASPWLRFLGILGFVGTGLVVLWGIVLFGLMPIAGQTWGQISGMGFNSFGRGEGAVFSVIMGLFVIGTGALMFFPSLFVYRFGDRIRRYLRNGAEQDLELAFKNNKSFWKFTGIVCIIYVALIPVMIIAGIIMAVVALVAR